MPENKISDTKTGGTTGGSTKPKNSGNKRAAKSDITEDLQGLFDAVAFGAALAGDDFSAAIISNRSGALAEAWNNLAQKNASVMRVLRTVTEGSAWQETTMVTLSVLIPIAWHYNLVPARLGMLFAGDAIDSAMGDEGSVNGASAENADSTT